MSNRAQRRKAGSLSRSRSRHLSAEARGKMAALEQSLAEAMAEDMNAQFAEQMITGHPPETFKLASQAKRMGLVV